MVKKKVNKLPKLVDSPHLKSKENLYKKALEFTSLFTRVAIKICSSRTRVASCFHAALSQSHAIHTIHLEVEMHVGENFFQFIS